MTNDHPAGTGGLVWDQDAPPTARPASVEGAEHDVVPTSGRAPEPREALEPEALEPDPDEPEIDEPEVVEPQVVESEAPEAEIPAPVVAEPVVAEPVVAEPEVDEPEVDEPEIAEPEIAEPEVDEPEIAEPEIAEPEIAEPVVAEPEIDEPEIDEPEIPEPNIVEPELPDSEIPEPQPVEPQPVEPQPVEPHPHGRHRAATELLPAVRDTPNDAPPAAPDDVPTTTSTTSDGDDERPAPAPVDRRNRFSRTFAPRRSRGQVLAAVLCAVLGFAMVAQARQTNVEGLASLRQSDLVQILAGLNEQSARLDSEVRDLQQTRDQLRSGTDSDSAAQDAAQDRLDVLGILTGTVAASGPGIELSIRDPDHRVSADVLLNTIQELRGAGAEAIQIGDVRVVAPTSFIDADGDVVVDGNTLAPPYKIRAIGDPQALSTALNIPGGVLEVLDNAGASGHVRRLDAVKVDALRALRDAQYARPAPTKD